MIGPRQRDARTRKTQRLRLEVLEGRDLPAGASTAHALLQGMTSHGVVRSAEVRTDQPVAGPTQSAAGPIRSMAGPVRLATANPVVRTKFVKAGDWVTLETYWHTNATLTFLAPARAQIKVRYGGGWIFGWDSQKQTLDGVHAKTLSVSQTASILVARVQIKVPTSTNVTYSEARTGP
jgi:hypothetical protein